MHHLCPTDLSHTDGGSCVPLELIPALTSILHFNQTGTWNMASVFMLHVTLVICASVLIPSASWSHEECKERRDIPPCNYTFSRNESSGHISVSVLFENETIADKCGLGIFTAQMMTIYQSFTLWCSEKAPRIFYDCQPIFVTRSVNIKNCRIYWKDLDNMFSVNIAFTKELILDDSVAELWTGERQDFDQFTMSGVDTKTIYGTSVNFRLLSSVVRPISQVFIRYVWSSVHVLSVKGYVYSFLHSLNRISICIQN